MLIFRGVFKDISPMAKLVVFQLICHVNLRLCVEGDFWGGSPPYPEVVGSNPQQNTGGSTPLRTVYQTCG